MYTGVGQTSEKVEVGAYIYVGMDMVGWPIDLGSIMGDMYRY